MPRLDNQPLFGLRSSLSKTRESGENQANWLPILEFFCFVSAGNLLLDSTSCECPLECEKVSYDVQVFSSTFPSKTYNTTAAFKKFMLSTGQGSEGDGGNFQDTIRWDTFPL